MAKTEDLPTILRAALHTYEQARAVRLQAERQADSARQQSHAELSAAEKGERNRLESAQRSQLAVASGEQARLGDLAAAVNALEEAAHTALTQAGLAHIAGAPTAVDGNPAPTRRGDAEVTERFVQAQTSYVALRETLYRLAAAQLDAGQWEAARKTLSALLANNQAPLYDAAVELQKQAFRGSLNLVHVPSGEFVYDVGNQRIKLPEFWISYNAITYDQFKAFVDATRYSASPGGAGNAPVNTVSWDDAQAFCAWAGVALPSEQQLVKAAITPDEQGKRRIDIGRIEWEWCANPHESGGYALRKYVPSTDGSGVGRLSRFGHYSNPRNSYHGFRVVAP